MLCQIPDTVAPHFRRVYGYIGAAQTDEKMTSTSTPIQFNVVLYENSDKYFQLSNFISVLHVPFYFGAEKTASWVWLRTLAFAKLCALPSEPQPFMIGDPVCGILEIVGQGDLASSQLVGWRRAEFSEWKLACSHMFSNQVQLPPPLPLQFL